nr:integrase, catalytic region, zinc finger, CCHC-type, peptidase aspartic, catalytic [Tanacetum cinerariifolium]
GKKSRGRKQKAKVSFKEIQMTYRPKVLKPKNVGTHECLATPKPRKPRFLLRWSPTGKMFDSASKLVAPSGCFKHMTGNLKLLINFVWKFMGTVRFENDHVAAILGFGDFK